ncbi:aspartate carbamoyltransferase catalytic subunit [Mycoplasmatota bacterium WC44]
MKNLFKLSDLNVKEINGILDEAQEFSKGKTWDGVKGKKIANLFFEPSTRTHYSFIVAEQNLGMIDTNFNTEASSVKKGETLYDTLKTFESIGFDALVVRHPDNNYFKQLDGINIPIMSGGDGTGNHPTQSLLDLLTIRQEFESFENLKVVIVGDIRHSRVAHTNIEVMKKLGMEVYISGPKEFDDGSAEYMDYNEAIKICDVVMLLRVQYERHGYNMTLTKDEYHQAFGLTSERVNQMKDNAIIMHPAPYNRGTEIADEVVECSKSRIMKQMSNGVYTRMAVIKRSLS